MKYPVADARGCTGQPRASATGYSRNIRSLTLAAV